MTPGATSGSDRAPAPRRSGPPRGHQGFVVVGCALAVLVGVITATSSGLHWGEGGKGGGTKALGATTTTARQTRGGKSGGSTTVLVGVTTLFVTTTVPLTTTSSTSTTSTLPRNGGLLLVGGPLTLSTSRRSATVRLGNASKRAFSWAASPSLAEIGVSPASGRLRPGSAVEITVSYEGTVDTTTRGSVSFTTTARGRGSVGVTLLPSPVRPLVVSAPTLTPPRPDCTSPVTLTVSVSNGVATSVRLDVSHPGGVPSVSLVPVGGGVWQVTIPAQQGGVQFAGTVVATAADGRTASAGAQFSVAHVAGVC